MRAVAMSCSAGARFGWVGCGCAASVAPRLCRLKASRELAAASPRDWMFSFSLFSSLSLSFFSLSLSLSLCLSRPDELAAALLRFLARLL